jgi:hypothetical protein
MHACDLGDERLGHLLQVVGGKATAKPHGPPVEIARNVAQGEVATPAESALDLKGKAGSRTWPWGRRKLASGGWADE